MHSIGDYELQVEQAEQSVLGAILLDSNVLDEIVFLEDRDFLNIRHQQIYRVMRWLDKRDKPVDITTVVELYMQHNKMDEVSISYITQLSQSCPTTTNIVYYANIVRSKALRRRGATLGNEIIDLSREDFETDEEYFSAIEGLVSELRPQDDGKMKSFEESRQDYFKHLLKKAEFIPSGFKQFDEWAHGLWKGWLFVSAGRPSVGKTAMLLQRICGVSQSGPVLLYSQEMDENQIKDRMISNISGIPYGRIKNKEVTTKEYGMLEEAYNKLEALPIFIQDSSGITIDEVRATAKRFKRKYGKIAMIAVDYLQIMKIPQKKGETRAQAVGNVTTAAKQIAREMKCCFMMLSQMTRESEIAKKPTLSHLKESSSIEQDADVVEFLWHDPNDRHQEGKVVQQLIAKGRDVGINEFRLLFRGWKQQFMELSQDKTK
jgi:replicative DNA helicase